MSIPAPARARHMNAVILSEAPFEHLLATQDPQRTVILSEAPERAVGESNGAKSKDPCISLRSVLPLVAAIVLLIVFATIPAHAQGCAQCLDSTRATPPAVQASYRHAIYLLGGAASAFFIAGLILLRREH